MLRHKEGLRKWETGRERERLRKLSCSYLQDESQEVSTLDWQHLVSMAQAEKQ